MLTDIPIGTWASALALDLFGGRRAEEAADRLIGAGVLAALPTAATGLSDWSDYLGSERRIGFVHAVANVTAVACYSASYVARRRGSRGTGLALSMAGAAALGIGGHLGGHLSYILGVNVNRNAWDHGLEDGPRCWPRRTSRTGSPPSWKRGERPSWSFAAPVASTDTCGHAGGPLHEGAFEEDCVVCPWHGSTFRLDDGGRVHGPATIRQPVYDVRIENGKVLLRSAR